MDNQVRKSRAGKIIAFIIGVVAGVAVDFLIGYLIGLFLPNDFLGTLGIVSLFMFVACICLVMAMRYFGIGFTIGAVGTPIVIFLIFLGTCGLLPWQRGY